MKASDYLRSRDLEIRKSGRFLKGFTFVEMLVAVAIFAITITTGVIAYQSISSQAEWTGGSIDVTLPSGVSANFYGLTNNIVAVNMAPSMGEVLRAESMRELLYEDLSSSIAAFCLARNGINDFRPSTIAVGAGFDPRTNITPAQFRALLGAGGDAFTDYNGAATNLTNTTLFVLEATTNAATTRVRAIYEADFNRAVSPQGIYASVRRYVQGTLTTYYHVFYSGTNTHNFLPPVAYFDRSIRPTTGTNAIDRYLQAANMPFYFLWWPDPSNRRFYQTISTNNMPTGLEPRAGYWQMADRSSYFFVIPALPAL
jgi:prepilin-type N-terminal cleavage/methylation domain-containing protein